jgi:micrococcal nuclease
MDLKRGLVVSLVIVFSLLLGSFLIWQGLNLEQSESREKVLETLTGQLPQVKVSPSPSAISSLYSSDPKAKVTKVIDGDTFEASLDGQKLKVRMIGVDTPETVDPRRAVGCFGKQASNETKRLIEGKEVILIKDVSETDKYNRLLRYVFLPIGEGNNLFINDYLVRQGFAKVLTYPPDVKYDSRFLEAEREARENLRGLWGECK